MTKIRTTARALGLAGLLAVAVVGASGCNNPATGVDSPQTAESSTALADGKVEYSITDVELHKQSSFVGEDPGQVGQVVAIRWHAKNVGSTDAWACPIMKVYQNKRALFVGTAEDIDDPGIQELAPGGEFDGVDVYKIEDLPPVEIKITNPHGSSNEVDRTFNLE